MRVYHFTTDGQAGLIKDRGDWGITVLTPWLGRSRSGVDLADGTTTDAYSPDTSWLVVVEVDEAHIAAYEVPKTPILRSLLAGLTPGRRGREWLVPPEILDTHARVLEIGDFSNPRFAARHRA